MNTPTKLFSILLLLIGTIFIACDDEDVVPLPIDELVAIAGPDRTVRQNEQLTLDASATENANKKPFSVLWSIKTKPQGSNPSIATPQSLKTIFKSDFVGTYVLRLTLMKGDKTAFDELTITVTQSQSEGPQTIVLNENITTNTVLEDIFDDAAAIDYLVTGNIVVRANLTIRPGVVIAFAEDKGIEIITGFISAKGTSDKQITFKGFESRSGYWKGILVHSNSESNEFEYIAINGGGSSVFTESGVKANLTVGGTAYSGGAVKISHTSFALSGGYGFYLQGMSSLKLFSSNSFSGNAATAFVAANQLHKIEADSFTGMSGLLEIETGGVVISDEPVTWNQIQNGFYLVSSDISVAAGVNVEAGASFKMQSGVTINVTDHGFLNATGSQTSRILFTSTNVSTYWNGLYFNTYNENNKLLFCDVSNAGLDKIAGSEHSGNIVLGHSGVVTIEHSVIKNGLGYGVVAKTSNQMNEDITQVNTFVALENGPIFPEIHQSPELPPLTGVWLDEWSFRQGFDNIQDNFYNNQTQVWFGGAANPWVTGSEKGMGIRFDEDQKFLWLIAEHSPSTGCESYSAEYITGSTTVETDAITFNQDYWRSKFINSCDPSQNVDMNVMPSPIRLGYKIERMYNVLTYEGYWMLTFTNPDGSRFSFYRR